MSVKETRRSLWTWGIAGGAVRGSLIKLNPRTLMKNPVMFVVEVGAAITTVELLRDSLQHTRGFGFELQITLWLWFTVLFANFAEAMAEGRGKAQADTLRKARAETIAHRIKSGGAIEEVTGSKLRSGDLVKVVAGEFRAWRWRSGRRCRFGRRVGDHRGIGTGDSRVGRRPVGGDRRHPRTVGPDHREDYLESRGDVS